MMMLCKNPLQRPSAAEALQHQWFKEDEAILKELLQLNKFVCSNEAGMLVASGGPPGNHNNHISADNSLEAAKSGPQTFVGSFLLGNNYFKKQAGAQARPSLFKKVVTTSKPHPDG